MTKGLTLLLVVKLIVLLSQGLKDVQGDSWWPENAFGVFWSQQHFLY